MTFYSSLKGGGSETVTITFLKPTVYLDQTGNGMIVTPMTGSLSKYDFIDSATKAKLDAAGENSMVATLSAMALNLGISLIFGGSISAMWTMVNTI